MACPPGSASPVFTVDGRYTSRGWTEWTQGFQFGSAILQFDATDDAKMLEAGRRDTVRHMASHVSHIGVHDHGFNNVSTYGAADLRSSIACGPTSSRRVPSALIRARITAPYSSEQPWPRR